MTLKAHILSLNGLTPESTREAIAYDAQHNEVWRGQVTAEQCFCTSQSPSYWSLFMLADHVRKNVSGSASSCFA